jgi:drug/metabolite transporter (DMT)-like permease
VRMGVLALMWGSGFLWIKLALTGLSPVQVTVLRCVLGASVLLALAWWARHRLPRDRPTWRRLVIAAFFCNTLPFALFSFGEQTVDSGVAGVLNATTPLWSMVIGFALGERFTGVRLAGLGLGFCGVVVIFAPWQQHGFASWGALALLAAAASYAVAFAYMGRHLVNRGDPLGMSAAQLLVATGLAALALPAGGLDWSGATTGSLLAVGVLGVVATGLTFHLNNRLIAAEGATAAATVGYLLPVVSVALGAVVLGEDVGLRVLAGMGVVLAGVALTRQPAATRRKVRP